MEEKKSAEEDGLSRRNLVEEEKSILLEIWAEERRTRRLPKNTIADQKQKQR